jgi:hypothetical protein
MPLTDIGLPGPKKSSSRISHIKKVHQQFLLQRKGLCELNYTSNSFLRDESIYFHLKAISGKGAFNNYVDSFYTLSVDKNRHFVLST